VWNDARTMQRIANLLVVVAMLVMTVALGAWTVQRPLFTLSSIEILPAPGSALRYVSSASVRTAIAGRLVGNFFTMNLDQARLAFETVPWVRRASVRRVWPNALQVSVEEQHPLALWNEHQMINAEGETFTANLGELDDDAVLPLFVGPDGAQKLMVQRYMALKHWFAPLGVQVDLIELTPRYAWLVNLSNGMTLDLGRDPDADAPDPGGAFGVLTFADRVARFVRAWPEVLQRLDAREVTHADLRYANGFALTLVDMPDPQPKKKP